MVAIKAARKALWFVGASRIAAVQPSAQSLAGSRLCLVPRHLGRRVNTMRLLQARPEAFLPGASVHSINAILATELVSAYLMHNGLVTLPASFYSRMALRSGKKKQAHPSTISYLQLPSRPQISLSGQAEPVNEMEVGDHRYRYMARLKYSMHLGRLHCCTPDTSYCGKS